MDTHNIVLNVNGIEVIYNHVILVLKGVSLQVPQGKIVAILGGNGAGKTTTLRAISNLLQGVLGATELAKLAGREFALALRLAAGQHFKRRRTYSSGC